MKKPSLRKLLRQRRNALGAARQAQAAIDLAELLKTLPVFRQSGAIALYLANDGEIDPARALAWCLQHGKRCYAPIIEHEVIDDHASEAGKNTLRFAEITASARFQTNRFGIAEPVAAAGELIDASQLELALLPLVGFDSRGNRIGMGGGYYDATFEFKKTNPRRLPHMVGLAHDSQRVERIDAEQWDIPISVVVTDQRIYRCDPSIDDSGMAMQA